MISVIVPVYNAARFLHAAIESILAQTTEPDEVVVVDDGSTDASARIAAGFGGNVRVIEQPHLGGAAALNHGVRASRGDLLAFLDADDMWSSTKIARQIQLLESEDSLDAVVGGVAVFSDPLGKVARPADVVALANFQQGISKGAMLIRRSAFDRVGEFSIGIAVADFPDWYGRALDQRLRFGEVDEVVLFRRIHGANTSRANAKTLHGDYLKIARAAVQRRRNGAPTGS